MTRRIGIVAGLAMIMMLVTTTGSAAGSRTGTIFTAKTNEGQVWVSVDIARYRRSEAYIPLAVAVYNTSRHSAVLDRGSFQLIGTDGVAEKMPTIRELRKRYTKQSFDLTMIRLYGMPFGTRLDLDDLVPSNFFPVVGPGNEGIRIQRVQLPQFYWTIDLLYFPRPSGFAKGQPAVLVVSPKGWQKPIRVTLHL
ncbi:MAG: hypothetical protein GXP48_08270 [Acidobacteria bacterium]|nr:hypothetical protein [Acidobacteriota bacterium]